MIVTLRKFLEIAPDIICPDICIVHLEYEHEDWGQIQNNYSIH